MSAVGTEALGRMVGLDLATGRTAGTRERVFPWSAEIAGDLMLAAGEGISAWALREPAGRAPRIE
jgi:hypothetical protein